MGITERAVKNPAGVAVAVAIITLFGLFSLSSLPVQLFPDIDLPQLSIQANWRAASPREIDTFGDIVIDEPCPEEGVRACLDTLMR